MKVLTCIWLFSLFNLVCINRGKQSIQHNNVLKVEMYLNPNGIKSESFPAIDAKIDFVEMKSRCLRKYPSPRMRDSYYFLSEKEIDKLLLTLNQSDLSHLQKTYSVTNETLPKSICIIYTKENKYIIEDYGLNGEYPLSEMYRVVYKF